MSFSNGTYREGMWIDHNGILRGEVCWNYGNTALAGVNPQADGSKLTNGSYMFYGCSGLKEWNVELPNLTNGSYMFQACSELTSFTAELKNLTNGTYMFFNSIKLANIDVGTLPNLTNGTGMFESTGTALAGTVKYDLGKITTGGSMFRNCSRIVSFEADLSRLNNGDGMFEYCSQLLDFKANLTALSVGTRMFNGCRLNLESVQRIASTIKTHTDGAVRNMPIGVDKTSVSQEKQDELNAILAAKGWTIQWQRR